VKLLYKPFGLLAGMAAGALAGAIFKWIWALVAGEADTPNATDKARTWPEVIAAAALEGAVFAGVKAAVDRAGATGFERVTGAWPGNTNARKKRRSRLFSFNT
jgi:hypothetical protein